MSDFTYQDARDLFFERDGVLHWRERNTSEHFSQAGFNKRCAGRPIGVRKPNSDGYYLIQTKGVRHGLHRVVWLYYNGEWPQGEIDHINGDPADNRIENLRVVDRSVNSRNMARRSDNKSGFAGVNWDARKNKWQASICVRGVRRHLGSFADFEVAKRVRAAASAEFGFTERHGR